MDVNKGDGAMEIEAIESFVRNFHNDFGHEHPVFNRCTLKEAITTACFAPITERKILLLYFHNRTSSFAEMFCKNLTSGEARDVIEKHCFLLAWDVENTTYHEGLIDAVKTNLDPEMERFITVKCPAVFLIFPIENMAVVFTVITEVAKQKDLITTLQQAVKSFQDFCNVDQGLEILKQETSSTNDFDSRTFQQVMFNQLSDRDYDSFEENEHELLHKKIGFSLYGSPQDIQGYNEKQKKQIEKTFKKILSCSDEISKWKNYVVVSFVYNCVEPLSTQKIERAKIYEHYNPNTDISPQPLYVLRKCKGSEQPCRLFIDADLRVYKDWTDYLQNNELDKCQMVLPRNGRYKSNEEGHVLLEKFLSPACGVGTAILKKLDTVSSAVALTSTGVILAALIPTLTIAPLALTVAAAAGVSAGIYSAIRSGINLVDKKKHKESLNFRNPGARSDYINIIAGSLGFAGAGANVAVSHLISNGIAISNGALTTVDLMNILGQAGRTKLKVTPSSYDVYKQWRNNNEKELQLTQLTYSVLFFGNLHYHIDKNDENLADKLLIVQDSQRNNRYRKVFEQIVTSSKKRTDEKYPQIIASIYDFNNSKNIAEILMNSAKIIKVDVIKFIEKDGRINFNGVPIDIEKFDWIFLDQKLASAFLSGFSSPIKPGESKIILEHLTSVFDVDNMESVDVFDVQLVDNSQTLVASLSILLGMLEDDLQIKIIRLTKSLLDKLIEESFDFVKILKVIFPATDILVILIGVVMFFLVREKNKHAIEDEEDISVDFDETTLDDHYRKIIFENFKRAQRTFTKTVNFYSENLSSAAIEELHNYFFQWLSLQIYICANKIQKRRNRKPNHVHKIKCDICGGYKYGDHP